MVSTSLMFKFAVLFVKAKYKSIFYVQADPRIRDKLFMGSPIEIVVLYLNYAFLTSYVLPKFMEHRKPFNFKALYGYIDKMLLVIESYFLYWGLIAWFNVYNWACQPIDTSDTLDATLAVEICWQFLITRFLYMLQSLPHVLSKKKSSEANFTLIYNTIFPIMVWFAVNYYPGGHVSEIFLIFIQDQCQEILLTIIFNLKPCSNEDEGEN